MSEFRHEKFARLEDTRHGQILCTIQRDTDGYGDGPTVKFRLAERCGLVPEYMLGPWPDNDDGWTKAQTAFESVDLQALAKELATQIDALSK